MNIENQSIQQGYVPADTQKMFESLIGVTDILDQLSVPYILTGGTLLGAVREGRMLTGDTDWDLEILNTSVDTILNNAERFTPLGLHLTYPHTQTTMALGDEIQPLAECERRIIKFLDHDGKLHGDLFIQTLFSDGILRRVNLNNNAYFNAKMSFPYWFFENRKRINLGGHAFYAPAEPEMMVKRIYGPRWQTPMDRHHTPRGYNFAGAHSNANMETGVRFALSKGWIPRYPDAPKWPRAISHTSTPTSKRWISRHEHLSKKIGMETHFNIDEQNARLILHYRAQITSLKKELRTTGAETKLLKSELKKLKSGLKKKLVKSSDLHKQMEALISEAERKK